MKLSSIEAVFSDKGNEAGLAQRNLPYAGVVPLDEGERLSAACPHRDQQATPGRELLDERPRDLGTSRRDQDGVVGRVGAPPQRPVAVQHRHVRRTRQAQRLLGGARQRLDPFHREDRGGERAQQRGLVPRSCADLEHFLPPGQSQCREIPRSEEHTSELQSRGHLVCRLLLEKKKKKITYKLLL